MRAPNTPRSSASGGAAARRTATGDRAPAAGATDMGAKNGGRPVAPLPSLPGNSLEALATAVYEEAIKVLPDVNGVKIGGARRHERGPPPGLSPLPGDPR